MSESEPLLPAPNGGNGAPQPRRQRSSSLSTMTNAMRNLGTKKSKKTLPYALLLLLGALLGAGGMYAFYKRPHTHEKPPMVPPIYKLPPVRAAPATPHSLGAPLTQSLC